MNTIGSIQAALADEYKAENNVQEKEFIPESIAIKNTTPETQTNVVFRLVNSNRKGGLHLPYTDHVINPSTITEENPSGNIEMIRLLTGVSSIWVKDQKDLSETFIKNNRRIIEFPRGNKFITIPDWDKTALEFMRVCRHNIGNPNRKTGSKFEFYEYNPEQVAKWKFEREALEADMIVEAKLASKDSMMKHAPFLGISMVDEFGLPKGEMAIRAEYMVKAKNNPERFKETLKSEEVDIFSMVHKAIQEGIIDLGRETNKAYWAKGGELICAYPQSEKAIPFLTKLALTADEVGKKFKTQLKSRIT